MRTRFAIAALCALSLAAPSWADTINVPRDQATIADAVKAAADGDTIVIAKGTYAENVDLDGFDGITVRAKGKVTIAPSEDDEPCIRVVNCSNVTLQGLGVEGGFDGIFINDCTDVDVVKFRVSNAGRHGVFVFGSSNVNLTSGKIDNCVLDGVSYADEEPDSPVRGGTISKVKVRDCDEDGFDILGSNINVLRCSATNCDDDGFESDDEGAGPVRFEKCKATDAGDEGFELATPSTTAIKCSSKGSDEDGFDIEADSCVLEKCSAKGSDEAGFSIDSIANGTLTKCKATKSDDQGFDFLDATNMSLEKCKATRSGGDGFRLDSGTTDCVLSKCKAAKSGGVDLRDESNGSNTFPGSKFKTRSED